MQNIIPIDIIGYSVAWYALGETFYWLTPAPPSAYKNLKQTDSKQALRKKPRHSMYNNWVSLIHAAFIIATCGYSFLYGDDSLHREFSRFETMMVKISLAYYLYDTSVGYYYGFFDAAVYAHHFCITSLWVWGLCGQNYACEVIKPMFFAEVTHPLNIMRIYCTEMDHKFWKAVHYFFYVIMFIFIRVFLTPYFCVYLQLGDYPIFVKLIFSLMWFIGMVWSWMVLNLGAKEIASYFPSVEFVYQYLKKLRKFDKLYYAASFVWAFGCIFLYLVGFRMP